MSRTPRGTSIGHPGRRTEWCCEHEGRGCDDRSKPYDCDAGLSKWKSGWSEGKKAWCCRHEHKACEDRKRAPSPTTARRASTTGRPAGPKARRSGAASTRARRAARVRAPRPTPPSTVRTESATPRTEWAVDKQSYCCSYAGIGCGDEPSGGDEPGGDEPSWSHSGDRSDPFDCYSGYVYTNWKKTWSSSKKKWCCEQDSSFCSDGGERPHGDGGARTMPSTITRPLGCTTARLERTGGATSGRSARRCGAACRRARRANGSSPMTGRLVVITTRSVSTTATRQLRTGRWPGPSARRSGAASATEAAAARASTGSSRPRRRGGGPRTAAGRRRWRCQGRHCGRRRRCAWAPPPCWPRRCWPSAGAAAAAGRCRSTTTSHFRANARCKRACLGAMNPSALAAACGGRAAAVVLRPTAR
ncbi:unnamed protein product [Prorocentrum cordatum]|uniref:Cellulase n=1 Tax=Prorocentrum cordatum TaxID=2364126 RepID=A0ABN9UL49_9DINO|nr:unnamed protein product [Polarella glacialis]